MNTSTLKKEEQTIEIYREGTAIREKFGGLSSSMLIAPPMQPHVAPNVESVNASLGDLLHYLSGSYASHLRTHS